jgi:hypothetical protein
LPYNGTEVLANWLQYLELEANPTHNLDALHQDNGAEHEMGQINILDDTDPDALK